MRIVVFSPSLPLPFGTADARWLYVMLGELSGRGIDVTVISCTEQDEGSVVEAHRLCEGRGVELIHVPLHLNEGRVARKTSSLVRPFSEFLRCTELSQAIDRQLSKGYDVFHIEHLFPTWAGLHYDRSVTYLHHLEVVDWQGRPDLDLRQRLTYLQMRRATRSLLKEIDKLLVATPRLAVEVGKIRGSNGASLPVVPIAIDPDIYKPIAPVLNPVVGVIGSMHWYPSRSAAERVVQRQWPAIAGAVPDARLLVAGWGSDTYLSKYFPLEGADLLGPVDKPPDFFEQIAVLLYPPARGSGMKVKVLEAFAYGIPAISNQEGFEGITIQADSPGISAESDGEFVDRTIELLREPHRRRVLGQAARTLVETQYSPKPAIDRLLVAYERVGLTR